MMVAGTELKITPEGVFVTTNGTFKVKADTHVFEEGESVPLSLPRLPKFDKYNIAYHFVNDEGIPYANTEYEAKNKRTGEILNGVTDDDGWSERFYSDQADEYEIHLKLDWQNSDVNREYK